MLKWLTGKQPIPVWAIKQIDDDLLHLCGQAKVTPTKKRGITLAALNEGRYQGAVSMAGSGLVLNARLFAALVPVENLTLDAQGQAHWQGRCWQVSQVPQRCWTYEGRLTTQRQLQGGQSLLVSVEDVSSIRRHARISEGPNVVPFDDKSADDHPLIAPRDGEHTRPARPGKGWERRTNDDEH
ncbi:hypothetical protein HOP52_18045 [Halomonas campisalis]|uniref:Uncharacterized protein n=1 Tax=Billgrantia campisalis TaxID=74661 RepID=A0ABS9PD08_9GAMM|nr:hypothetical protein [Halomonas campisalis]MCG6659653.1 hypothetical protein [Halomonas campisalis]MDR5864609.1 hypothetical protein [Halomonas campisalis]